MTTDQLEEALREELSVNPQGDLVKLLHVILTPGAAPMVPRLLALAQNPTRRVSLKCLRGHWRDWHRVCMPCEAIRLQGYRTTHPYRSRAKPKVPDSTDEELDEVLVARVLHNPDVRVERVDKPAMARALSERGWTNSRVSRRLHLSGSSVLRALGGA